MMVRTEIENQLKLDVAHKYHMMAALPNRGGAVFWALARFLLLCYC